MKNYNYKQVNWDTYIATVEVSHWYYGSKYGDFVVELNDDDDCMLNILKDILENEQGFRHISWDKASISIDFVIDNKVYTKTVTIE